MTRRRRPRGALSVVVAAATLVAAVQGAAAARAASLTLTPIERRDAVRFGVESVARDAFDAEWRVTNPDGETVLVVTPFHRAAIAARHAAFRNQDVKPGDIERVLREQRDRLVLWVHLKGPREDFARGLTPELRIGDRAIKPAFVQNERTASMQDGVYLARCYYAFPAKDLTGRSRVALIVRDAEGRQEHRFTIDLATMR